jgi:hypothetical protein
MKDNGGASGSDKAARTDRPIFPQPIRPTALLIFVHSLIFYKNGSAVQGVPPPVPLFPDPVKS